MTERNHTANVLSGFDFPLSAVLLAHLLARQSFTRLESQYHNNLCEVMICYNTGADRYFAAESAHVPILSVFGSRQEMVLKGREPRKARPDNGPLPTNLGLCRHGPHIQSALLERKKISVPNKGSIRSSISPLHLRFTPLSHRLSCFWPVEWPPSPRILNHSPPRYLSIPATMNIQNLSSLAGGTSGSTSLGHASSISLVSLPGP